MSTFENGEFKGTVKAQIRSMCKSLDEIKAAVAVLDAKFDVNCLKTASLRTQVKVLWGAAGVLFATVIATVVKLFIGGRA